MTDQRRQEIAARVEKATKGPWSAEEMTHYGQGGTGFWSVQPIGEPDDMMTEADADFIAHAREDIPDLLSALTAAETAQQEAESRAQYAEREQDRLLLCNNSLSYDKAELQDDLEAAEAKVEAAETRAREAEERADKAEGALEVAEDALRSSR